MLRCSEWCGLLRLSFVFITVGGSLDLNARTFCRIVRTKKNSFRPKMAKNCQFFAENSVFLAGVVSFRAPYPILRVPNPVKCVWNCIGATYWVLQGRQHRKKNSFSPKMAENCQFLAKNSVFSENNRVGGTPLSFFERAE